MKPLVRTVVCVDSVLLTLASISSTHRIHRQFIFLPFNEVGRQDQRGRTRAPLAFNDFTKVAAPLLYEYGFLLAPEMR